MSRPLTSVIAGYPSTSGNADAALRPTSVYTEPNPRPDLTSTFASRYNLARPDTQLQKHLIDISLAADLRCVILCTGHPELVSYRRYE
jgi:hypothetical protein